MSLGSVIRPSLITGLWVETLTACSSGDLQLVGGTASGSIEGAYSSDESDVLAFRGVPYAAPPVRDLRFRPPAEPLPWEGVRTAYDIAAPCWQAVGPVSE